MSKLSANVLTKSRTLAKLVVPTLPDVSSKNWMSAATSSHTGRKENRQIDYLVVKMCKTFGQCVLDQNDKCVYQAFSSTSKEPARKNQTCFLYYIHNSTKHIRNTVVYCTLSASSQDEKENDKKIEGIYTVSVLWRTEKKCIHGSFSFISLSLQLLLSSSSSVVVVAAAVVDVFVVVVFLPSLSLHLLCLLLL